MTATTHTAPEADRQTQRGTARPVEPGTRYASLAWAELDDMLNTVRQASDQLWLIHMGAESHELTTEATGAIQQVAQDGLQRLRGVMETLEHHMHASREVAK